MPRRQSPARELVQALRGWCQAQHARATLDQATHLKVAPPPGLRWPDDNPEDWVEFISSPEARRLIRATIAAGGFEP